MNRRRGIVSGTARGNRWCSGHAGATALTADQLARIAGDQVRLLERFSR